MYFILILFSRTQLVVVLVTSQFSCVMCTVAVILTVPVTIYHLLPAALTLNLSKSPDTLVHVHVSLFYM